MAKRITDKENRKGRESEVMAKNTTNKDKEKKLDNIVKNTQAKDMLLKLGYDEKDINLETATDVALYKQAILGNVAAIKSVKEELGKKKLEQELKKKRKNDDYSRLVSYEEKKIKQNLKNLSDEELRINKNLIHNVAFMGVTMKKLSEDIAVNGVKEKYQNGNNQFGYKETPEIRTYNNMFKNYTTAMKQLTELLEKNAPKKEDDDGFGDF